MKCLLICLTIASFVIGPNVTAAAGITSNAGGGTVVDLTRGRGPYPPRPEPEPQPAPTPHVEGRWRGPCSDWWLGENLTPAMWNANPTRGARMMQRLIVCVFGVFAPGESLTALYIADRESGYYPWAANPSGCEGLFQHQVAYWPGRAATISHKLFAPWLKWPDANDPGRLIYDPRANAIAAAKMVASSGWGAWSTA